MRTLANYRDDYLQRVFRTVDVPEDLSTVTDIDTAGEVDPHLADMRPASVEAMAAGSPTSNHKPLWEMPKSRSSAIARCHKTLVENGPSGASRINRCETS